MNKKLKLLFFSLVFLIISFSIAGLVFAWTNPSDNPPSGNGALYFSGGNIGIGAAPSYKLDVAGNSRFSATSTFSGNVGIGTATPAAKLHVAQNDGAANSVRAPIIMSRYWASDMNTRAAAIYNYSNGSNDQFVIGVSGDGAGDTSPALYSNARMVVQANGDVGIGTVSPDSNYRLTTSGGGVKAENNSASQPAIYADNAGGGAAIQADTGGITLGGVNRTSWPSTGNNYWTLSGSNLYPSSTSYNVGIGTTNPTTGKLVISTTAGATGLDLATADSYAELRVIRNSLNASNKDMYIQYNAGSGSKLYLYSNNALTMTLSGGDVGIGTAPYNPGYPFQLALPNSSSYNDGAGIAYKWDTYAGGSLCISGDCRTSWPSAGTNYWTVSGSNIYNNNSGNVGIGATSPSSKLSVGGNGDSSVGIAGVGQSEGIYGITTYSIGYGVYGHAGPGNSFIDTSGGWTNGGGVLGVGGDVGVEGYSSSKYGVYGEGGIAGIYGDGTSMGSTYGVYSTNSGSGKYAFYANVANSATKYGPFTGGHDVILADDVLESVKQGMIMSVTGETRKNYGQDNTVDLSTTLPTVTLSNKSNDKNVIGVFTGEETINKDNWYYKFAEKDDRMAIVNALGEGRVLVTDINGDVQAGDYITTSEIPGYGMKQNDDLLHNYTLGKSTENVDWNKVNETVDWNGKEYKVYLIGVVYTSG